MPTNPFRRRSNEERSAEPEEETPALETQEDAPEPVRRSHERLSVRIRVLLMILLLVAAGALAVTGFPGNLPADVVAQWPWLLVILGAVWLLIGLVTASASGTLGGPLVIAVGVAALIGQQFVTSLPMTVAGVALVVLGAAVVLRGMTMPRVRR